MYSNSILAFGLAATLLAQSNAIGFGNFSSSGNGLQDVSPEQWKPALAAPNATGSIDVVGPATSATGDVGESQDTWTISVNVTADVPSDEDDSEYWTGTAISLTPPNSFIKKSENGTEEVRPESGWKVCSVFFRDMPANATEDDGTCKQVLGDDCVKDIKDRQVWNPDDCSLSGFPESCSSHTEKFGFATEVNGSNWLNEPLFGIIANEPHEKGNTSDYERAVTTYIPVILAWTVDLDTGAGTVASIPDTTVSCVRADNFTEGSQEFTAKDEDDDEDNGALVMKPSSTSMGMIAVAGMAMFL